nr:hypothetical protein [Tanacetum cinerariifolium]
MRMTIANNIKYTLPSIENQNAKDFLKLVEEKFCSADKALAETLMAKHNTMKFDGSKSMQQHVLDITNTAARPKTLGMNVDDSFLVQFIMNSLPLEYAPFHINYNILKDKRNIDELSSMFFVASVRKMIDDALIHSPNLNYRWNKYVPIKVNILVWKILNNSLPTKFKISRRARWWKVSIENFDCYDEWLEWIDSIRMSKKTKIMMEAVFYTLWWMIWWFRNSKIFKERASKKAFFL